MKKKWLLIITLSILFLGFHYNYTKNTKDPKNKADVLVVLGNSPNPNNKPNKLLQYRLDKAIELYNKGYAKNIIVTGSKVRDSYYEADVMKNYCIENNIPPNVIFLERKARTTLENAKYSNEIIKENDFKNVIVVTSRTHMARSKLIFSQYDLNCQFVSSNQDFLRYITSFPIYVLEAGITFKIKRDFKKQHSKT